MSDIIPYKIINNVVVKKIPAISKDPRPPKHYKLFDLKYLNIGLFGSTGCGKTTVILAIVKEMVGPDTIVIIFCGTGWDDDYLVIQEYVEKHGKELRVYDSMADEEEGNVLENLMKMMVANERKKMQK